MYPFFKNFARLREERGWPVVRSPFLGIGITRASFQVLGKIPVVIVRLKINVIWFSKTFRTDLRIEFLR